MTTPHTPEVVVIGESLIDIVETSTGTAEHVGGSPANVALGVGRRGIEVTLLTQLGPDDRGSRIIAHLESSGVTVAPASVSAESTSTASARIGGDGQASYVFDMTWNAFDDDLGPSPRVLHTGSLAAFLPPGAESVRAALRSSGAPEITFDPNIRPALLGSHDAVVRAFEETVRLVTVVKLSDEDAAWLYPGSTPDQVADALLDLGARVVAVTLGSHGAIIANGSSRVRIPAEAVDVVDTIGAGDTFMASLIVSVVELGSIDLDGSVLERIGRDAVAAAAVTVARTGADLPWARELRPGARTPSSTPALDGC